MLTEPEHDSEHTRPSQHTRLEMNLNGFVLTGTLGWKSVSNVKHHVVTYAVHVSLESVERFLREVRWLLMFLGIDMVRM